VTVMPVSEQPEDHAGHQDHAGHDDHARSADHSGHSHGVSSDADVRYLGIALGLLIAFMIFEVVVGLVASSLVLLADAGHMLSDALAIGAAIWAIRLAARPARGSWTFGFKRAEILSAAGNGITLLIVAAVIVVEAIQRLLAPPSVSGGIILIVALVGVVINLVATWVLAKANRSSLNVEGAFQHILTDLYAFIGTAVAGLIILLTGFARADSIASLVVAGLMVLAALELLRESGRVLLEGAPAGVSLDEVRRHLLELPNVRAVHDLHVWAVTSSMPTLSAHIVVDDACFSPDQAPQLLDRLQSCLAGHFDVEHSTFQLEPAQHSSHELGAHG
jgi:cobalt-zinc-cadmium efflux system protein